MAILIGHRGARSLAAENTLAGIRAAAVCGADGVEVDVRLTSDGSLVLMHDETLERTAGHSLAVSQLSLSEIQLPDVRGERIPTLMDAVKLARELDLLLVVEMKEEGLEELVLKELSQTAPDRVIVTSFYHESLREVRSLSSLSTGIIISSLPIDPIKLALDAEAGAIFPKRVNPNLFKRAHQAGLKVYPWTINQKSWAEWLLKLGADGLVTDDPCLIRGVMDQPLMDTGPENCKYYPCHFPGQDCTHCFCPLYPCRDETLGGYVTTKKGRRVWSCIDCTLVHQPEVAKYILEHPQAETTELKAYLAKLNRK